MQTRVHCTSPTLPLNHGYPVTESMLKPHRILQLCILCCLMDPTDLSVNTRYVYMY
jgi:hypothetical protein